MLVLLGLIVFMMRFKKIYIEITNGCNLNCSFCIGNNRKVKFMNFDEFSFILDKIRPYTDYLYFHILGEPLLHPEVNKFIEYAYLRGFKVNITTNGYLIDKIKYNNCIRQINISIHSFDELYGISISDYLSNIFDSISTLKNTFISIRMWFNNKYKDEMLSYICSRFNLSFDFSSFDRVKIDDRIFLSQFHEFIWPDLKNNFYSEEGRCYGLIDHLGILSDGSIVPCCLDSKGDICLGNIFNNGLDFVLNSDRVINMIDGFKKGYKCEELCRHCGFFQK